MSIIITYLSMLIFFVFAEMIVLTKFMQPLFQKNIGHLMRDQTNYSFAAIFYLVYVAGVFWFATRAGVKSESFAVALFSGAFLGLLSFGTYEITNYLILRDWKISLVIIDTSWGIIITGTMASLGYKINNLLS